MKKPMQQCQICGLWWQYQHCKRICDIRVRNGWTTLHIKIDPECR